MNSEILAFNSSGEGNGGGGGFCSMLFADYLFCLSARIFLIASFSPSFW